MSNPHRITRLLRLIGSLAATLVFATGCEPAAEPEAAVPAPVAGEPSGSATIAAPSAATITADDRGRGSLQVMAGGVPFEESEAKVRVTVSEADALAGRFQLEAEKGELSLPGMRVRRVVRGLITRARLERAGRGALRRAGAPLRRRLKPRASERAGKGRAPVARAHPRSGDAPVSL